MSGAVDVDPVSLVGACGQSPTDVLHALDTSDEGLNDGEAGTRRETYGANVLAERTVTAWGVLFRQLSNPLLILMLAAAGVAAGTGDRIGGGIIASIVLLSVGLGFFNEYRSEIAVAALHANIHHQTLVMRGGEQKLIDVADLVPGDVVTLRVGDVVPADLRLLDAVELECDEAVLTGESLLAARWSVRSSRSARLPTSSASPRFRSASSSSSAG